jgi:hypothetical protein
MLYRPLMFGSAAAATGNGELGARTTCLMMFYVLNEGVGHGEPLLANRAQMGRPSRYNGADFSRGREQNYCLATGTTVTNNAQLVQV